MKKQINKMLICLVLVFIALSAVGCGKSEKLVKIDGKWHYYDVEGNEQHGFVEYKENTYYITEDGIMNIGFWLNKEDEEYYYSDSDGVVQKNKFVDVDGKTYYLNADGKRQYGWAEIDGKTMYFSHDKDDGHMVKNSWIYDFSSDGSSKEYYYVDSEGVIQKNKFVEVDGRTYYLKADGTRQHGWAEIDGEAKYFSSKKDGHMVMNTWIYDFPSYGGCEEKYFFADEEGNIIRNEIREVGGNKYYFAPDGGMRTGFIGFQGNLYYFNNKGEMQIGSFIVEDSPEPGVTSLRIHYEDGSEKEVVDIFGKTCYADGQGVVQIKEIAYYKDGQGMLHLEEDNYVPYMLKQIKQHLFGNENDEESYYTNSEGVVQRNTLIEVDGKTYYINANGKKHHGWLEIDGKNVWFNWGDGNMTRNGWIFAVHPYVKRFGENKYFFADEEGNIIRNEIREINGEKYFFASDGAMQTGFIFFQGNTYYFDPVGRMQTGSFKVKETGRPSLDGKTFYTDEQGVVQNFPKEEDENEEEVLGEVLNYERAEESIRKNLSTKLTVKEREF